MAVPLAFDLVGDWTSARLLVRMVLLGEPQWEVRATGFTHRPTGERVTLAMGPPQAQLARAIAAGVDPARPSLDEALLEEVTAHRAVVVVEDPTGDAPLDRAATLLRAAGQIVNGGALAARCRSSGLSHGADGLDALVQRLDAEGDAVLVEAFVRFDTEPGRTPRTWGMHALGLPDVLLREVDGADRARARLEACALAWVAGEAPGAAVPDDAHPEDPRFNPYGRVSC